MSVCVKVEAEGDVYVSLYTGLMRSCRHQVTNDLAFIHRIVSPW